ncbi:hypothetical protein HERIO_2567 [Hepatospora eriocheir]|uniref:Uncharacterized protein n=1 Tax=Hepatospora eriocheir TaxID=1081669 RepID=A0A1X0Q6F5_9MICR|nr:hypothetical protein HERIO_2567 [Hepatospora eriocheir]
MIDREDRDNESTSDISSMNKFINNADDWSYDIMNHLYSNVLELLLRKIIDNFIEFLCVKGVLKRYVKCVSCQQDMEKCHTLEIEMERYLSVSIINVLITVTHFYSHRVIIIKFL